MFKKMFALASVTALTGLVASVAASGCSSTTAGGVDDGGTDPIAEAGADAKKPFDAGPEDDAAPATCPSVDPITAASIDAAIKWMPPAATQSVCIQQNIDDLKALFAKGGGGAKYADIKTTLGATCAPCVFTPKTASAWGVIVEDAGGFLRNDEASCFAQADSPACGKAVFAFDVCLRIACPTTCGDATAVTACQAKAAKGACKDLNAAVTPACPKLQAAADVCTGLLDAIVMSCGGGPDGGIDASSP